MKRKWKSSPSPATGSKTGPRKIIRIELTEQGAEAFGAIYRKRGMLQLTVIDRLTAWVDAQPESVQAAILDMYPGEIAPDVARVMLERMAKRPAPARKATRR